MAIEVGKVYQISGKIDSLWSYSISNEKASYIVDFIYDYRPLYESVWQMIKNVTSLKPSLSLVFTKSLL